MRNLTYVIDFDRLIVIVTSRACLYSETLPRGGDVVLAYMKCIPVVCWQGILGYLRWCLLNNTLSLLKTTFFSPVAIKEQLPKNHDATTMLALIFAVLAMHL